MHEAIDASASHSAQSEGSVRMLGRSLERRATMVGLLCSALCVAYFYLLDHLFLSSRDFSPIFRYLLTSFDSQAAWLGLAVCLLAAFWNQPAPILRWVNTLGQRPVALALTTAVLLAFGALAVYHDYPLSMDEYAAVFQSKVFALGQGFAQVPGALVDWLVVSGFNGSFLTASPQTGRVIGQYWPGFALLLAAFQIFHAAWLCNAALSGFAMYLIHWITREISNDRQAAGWAMLFTLASGAFVANGLSYYSMQAHLCANLLFVALLMKPSRCRTLGAGLVGSVALTLHNPVPHALFALPWIVAMVAQANQRRYLLPLLIGYLPGIGLGFGWLIFRSDIGSGGHEWAAMSGVAHGVFTWPAATLLNMRAAAWVKLWIWAVPCLFVFAVLGVIRWRASLIVRLLAASALLTWVGYLFIRFDQGHGWGFRYFHSAWGVIPILAGCAMAGRSEADHKLVSFAGATAILSLLIIVPVQLSQIEGFVSQHLAQLASPRRPGNNIYFIHPLGGFYVADMVQFDPLLRDRDLLLVSHGADLDARFVEGNWPNAVKIGEGPAAEQWYLGPGDVRVPIPGSRGQKQFVFTRIPPSLTPSPPSAADR
jgi:hypothetical protein